MLTPTFIIYKYNILLLLSRYRLRENYCFGIPHGTFTHLVVPPFVQATAPFGVLLIVQLNEHSPSVAYVTTEAETPSAIQHMHQSACIRESVDQSRSRRTLHESWNVSLLLLLSLYVFSTIENISKHCDCDILNGAKIDVNITTSTDDEDSFPRVDPEIMYVLFLCSGPQHSTTRTQEEV